MNNQYFVNFVPQTVEPGYFRRDKDIAAEEELEPKIKGRPITDK